MEIYIKPNIIIKEINRMLEDKKRNKIHKMNTKLKRHENFQIIMKRQML